MSRMHNPAHPGEVLREWLPEGHLALPYPFDLIDRLVMGRDRLGDLPVL